MRIEFQEYGVRGSKSGICPKCGKKASRSTKIYQTQNPFNKNKDGIMKSVDEIQTENKENLFKWKEEPVYHSRCEE